jgi:hypothetical protein
VAGQNDCPEDPMRGLVWLLLLAKVSSDRSVLTS